MPLGPGLYRPLLPGRLQSATGLAAL